MSSERIVAPLVAQYATTPVHLLGLALCNFPGAPLGALLAKATERLGFTPRVAAAGVLDALGAIRARCGVGARLVPALEALALGLVADAYDQIELAVGCAALAVR